MSIRTAVIESRLVNRWGLVSLLSQYEAIEIVSAIANFDADQQLQTLQPDVVVVGMDWRSTDHVPSAVVAAIKNASPRTKLLIVLDPDDIILVCALATPNKYWSEKEREQFIDSPVLSYDRSVEQAQIVVALGLNCGLRREEMVTVKAGDVDLFHKTIQVLGKGKKYREVPLNGHVTPLVEPIVRARRADQTLLVDANGAAIPQDRINNIIRVLARRAGITYKSVSPHTLRHSFATRLGEQGVELPTIQHLMGHARIEETLRYVHFGDESRRNAVELLVPRDDSDVKER